MGDDFVILRREDLIFLLLSLSFSRDVDWASLDELLGVVERVSVVLSGRGDQPR